MNNNGMSVSRDSGRRLFIAPHFYPSKRITAQEIKAITGGASCVDRITSEEIIDLERRIECGMTVKGDVELHHRIIDQIKRDYECGRVS